MVIRTRISGGGGSFEFLSVTPIGSLILIEILLNQPHFTDEETEAHRGEMTCPRPNSCQVSAPELRPSAPLPHHAAFLINHTAGVSTGQSRG